MSAVETHTKKSYSCNKSFFVGQEVLRRVFIANGGDQTRVYVVTRQTGSPVTIRPRYPSIDGVSDEEEEEEAMNIVVVSVEWGLTTIETFTIPHLSPYSSLNL